MSVGSCRSGGIAREFTPGWTTTPPRWPLRPSSGASAARRLLPDLARSGDARVITSSVHALVGLPGHPAYAAAKGGLTALTRQLAVEYGPAARVNCVVPGPIMTSVRVPLTL
ncbi:SDR family oxidoreductase [Streptosporangium album]|uniref:SDR family oxidoreductase n=1 Tax=Streptosporangium album TaxID=47479 RepID=UPI00161DFB72